MLNCQDLLILLNHKNSLFFNIKKNSDESVKNETLKEKVSCDVHIFSAQYMNSFKGFCYRKKAGKNLKKIFWRVAVE